MGKQVLLFDEAGKRVCLIHKVTTHKLGKGVDWGGKPEDIVAIKQIREQHGVGLAEALEIYKGADPETVKTGDVHILGYKDLLSCEVIIDGKTITQTTRGGAIGRGLLGGVMFGGIGAVVGALSSSSTSISEDTINQVNLKIIVNDTKQPVWLVNFLCKAAHKSSHECENAIKQANHWNALLTVLIKRADEEEQSPILQEKTISVSG